MKKICALLLTACLAFSLFGCRNRTMDYIIANEPCIKGVVTDTAECYITIATEPNGGGLTVVSLDTENSDSMTRFYTGDEVAVYYNGEIAESYPAQINTVYAITLENKGEQRIAIEQSREN